MVFFAYSALQYLFFSRFFSFGDTKNTKTMQSEVVLFLFLKLSIFASKVKLTFYFYLFLVSERKHSRVCVFGFFAEMIPQMYILCHIYLIVHTAYIQSCVCHTDLKKCSTTIEGYLAGPEQSRIEHLMENKRRTRSFSLFPRAEFAVEQRG